MGMDVYGKAPQSEKGEYFRNNVWWWRPLWGYCEENHADLADKAPDAHSNSGDGLDANDALELGKRLLQDIETGVALKWQTEYRNELASLPKNDCQYCDGTGIRADEVGIEHGMPTKELDEATAILVGRTHGYCNGCRGEGKVVAWAANYPFDIQNLQAFAEFCVDSGGFEIC
jgi:hypothetical protein